MSDLARRIEALAKKWDDYEPAQKLDAFEDGYCAGLIGCAVDLRSLLAETREEEKPTDIGQTDLDPDGNLLPSQRHVRAACGHIFTRGELVDGLYCPLCLRHYQTGIPSPGPFAPPASAGTEGPGLYAWPCDRCGGPMGAPGYFHGDVVLSCKCGYEKTIKNSAWLNDYRLAVRPVEGEKK